jgi:hypothetical protein
MLLLLLFLVIRLLLLSLFTLIIGEVAVVHYLACLEDAGRMAFIIQLLLLLRMRQKCRSSSNVVYSTFLLGANGLFLLRCPHFY